METLNRRDGPGLPEPEIRRRTQMATSQQSEEKIEQFEERPVNIVSVCLDGPKATEKEIR